MRVRERLPTDTMPVDRLGMLDDEEEDIEQKGGEKVEDGADPNEVALVILPDPTSGKDTFMKDFFGFCDKVKSDVVAISGATTQINKLTSEYNEAIANSAMKEIRGKFEKVVAAAGSSAKDSYRTLEKMKAMQPSEESDSGKRIKRSMVQMLTTKYIAEVKKFRVAQAEFNDARKTKVTRQLEIADENVNSEEIEQIISQGKEDEFIRQRIIGTQESKDIREKFLHAQVRRASHTYTHHFVFS